MARAESDDVRIESGSTFLYQRVLRRVLVPSLMFVSVLSLSACRGEITTQIDVARASATGSLVVIVSGEAAEAMRRDPATDQSLMEELTRRSSAPVEREDIGGDIIYRTAMPDGGEHVQVTGVAISDITTYGDRSTVTLSFERPTLLAEAFAASVAGEPDAAARDIVMQRSTSICADVRYPGAIGTVDGADRFDVARSDRSVKICANLEDLTEPVEVRVSGETRASPPWTLFGMVVLLVLLLTFVVRRVRH